LILRKKPIRLFKFHVSNHTFRNSLKLTGNHRWVITFFRTHHGFGFSSALRELGLPHNGLLLSLVSFNVGVEIGQLCIVGLMFPMLWYIRKQTWEVVVLKCASITIGLIGLFWFVQRAFFQ